MRKYTPLLVNRPVNPNSFRFAEQCAAAERAARRDAALASAERVLSVVIGVSVCVVVGVAGVQFFGAAALFSSGLWVGATALLLKVGNL